ncbi:hypothetical protein JGU71_28385 [Antrihabitans sp. YC3-6]|uniref:Uncharacterized protein n=1 Tax=Antrihabitans stalagmiti TaxID=2799499 RepID=A0A934NX79_9NOCA|nr:hypothetical protein [Antrihabitans stalagmiti]MBJ8342815.1 hypothetical protein [Antrihabitans stalagmiti]
MTALRELLTDIIFDFKPPSGEAWSANELADAILDDPRIAIGAKEATTAETFTNTLGGWADRLDIHALELAESGDYEGVVSVTAAAEALERRQAAADVRDNAPTVDRHAAINAAKLDEIRFLLQPIVDGCDVALTSREVSVDVMAIVEGN